MTFAESSSAYWRKDTVPKLIPTQVIVTFIVWVLFAVTVSSIPIELDGPAIMLTIAIAVLMSACAVMTATKVAFSAGWIGTVAAMAFTTIATVAGAKSRWLGELDAFRWPAATAITFLIALALALVIGSICFAIDDGDHAGWALKKRISFACVVQFLVTTIPLILILWR